MRVKVVCVGDELLDGRATDTNSTYIGGECAGAGARVMATYVVPDDVEAIENAVRAAAADADLVVVSGGLGPTLDDVTRDALARATHAVLVEDPGARARLEAKLTRAGRALDPINARQALFPAGADVLPNALGTADAFSASVGGARVVCLPGVPRELHGLFERFVRPTLPGAARPTWSIAAAGLAESRVAQRVEALGLGDAFAVSWLASLGLVRVRLSHDDPAALAEASARVSEALAPFALPGRASGVAEAVRDRCDAEGLRVVTAESCTGGLIAAALTELAGSSTFVEGGVVSYANAAKHALLGVDPALIATHGAVSGEVAAAMAAGALARSGAQAAVAVTGIAGPGGGSDEKPVGTVWIAAQGPRGAALGHFGFGDRGRATVRALTVTAALRMLERTIAGAAGDLAGYSGLRRLWAGDGGEQIWANPHVTSG
jgi:nicotinamide-nucleotide amidase